jgi:alkanesulfonate monooxygenase SsuD/methylene tetrahydromethanopterin reductase-like flavin-dependent oxidoreductase (luciferase family)
MLRLAGREADGAIINWLSPTDVRRVAGIVNEAAGGAEREIVARIFVCPSDRADVVRDAARFAIAAYMNVPVYAAFHEWLGRGEVFGAMWDAWKAGDRKAALAAIPDEAVDDLIVHGDPATCRARIQEYFDNGVTTSSLAIMPLDPELAYWDAVRALAPSATP